MTSKIIINHDLIDAPEFAAPATAISADLDAIRASQAEIARLVRAEIETQSATLKAEATAAVDYAKATAEKLVALIGSQKPKIVGIKVGDAKPIITGERPHAALAEIAEELHILQTGALPLNLWLAGPRGSGKTTLARQLAKGRSVPFGFISVQAGMSPAEFFGRWSPQGFVSAPLWEMLDKPGVFLLDELDRADANTLCALNSLTANGIACNPYTGETRKRHPDFVILGAGNTFGRGSTAEYSGANRLDASTLDRFAALLVDYDRDLEAELCPFPELLSKLHAARDRLTTAKSKEVIGTRAVQRAGAYHSAGLSEARIFAKLTTGWDSNSVKLAALA